jgi:predicted GIY-YIG superfamily endonuclease
MKSGYRSIKRYRPGKRNRDAGGNPKEIEKILKYVSPKGLYMQTNCDTEDDALDLLKQVKKWSKFR